MLREPAIMARIEADAELPLGEPVQVRLVAADPVSRSIRFELQGAVAPKPAGFSPRAPASSAPSVPMPACPVPFPAPLDQARGGPSQPNGTPHFRARVRPDRQTHRP